MSRPLLILCLIVYFIVPLPAQQSSQVVLQDITFFGCKRTTPNQLKKFLHLKIGSLIDEDTVKAIRPTLLNLGMFREVEVVQRILENQAFLIVSLEEKPPLILHQEVRFNALTADYPAEENELNYFGATIQRVDFSGRHNLLSFNFGIGSQDRLALSFTKKTCRQWQYGAVTGFTHYNSRLFAEESTVNKHYTKIFLAKSWLVFSLRWWAEWDRYWLPLLNADTASEKSYFDFWRSGIRAVFDLRDNRYFPQFGVLLEIGTFRTWQNSVVLYDALDTSISFFAPALRRSHSLALNLSCHLTSRSVPLIDLFSLGGYRVLRSLKRYEKNGSQALWGSLEYRIPIGNFNTRQKMSIAFSPYLFCDFGMTGEALKSMLRYRLEHNAGIGFLWQLGLENSMRIDFTCSPKFGITIGSNWKF